MPVSGLHSDLLPKAYGVVLWRGICCQLSWINSLLILTDHFAPSLLCFSCMFYCFSTGYQCDTCFWWWAVQGCHGSTWRFPNQASTPIHLGDKVNWLINHHSISRAGYYTHKVAGDEIAFPKCLPKLAEFWLVAFLASAIITKWQLIFSCKWPPKAMNRSNKNSSNDTKILRW